MMKRQASAIVVALFLSACGGINSPSSNKVETFTGTVQPANFGPTHSFSLSGSGEVLVTVTNITPGNVFLGVVYGQLLGSSCGPIQQTAVSTANLGKTAITAQAFAKGEYCVALFDAAAAQGLTPFSLAQNYTVTVSHP